MVDATSEKKLHTYRMAWWFGSGLNLKDCSDEDLLEVAIESLSSAFAKPAEVLKNKLVAHKIANWTNAQNIYGGYSYETPQSADAKKLLTEPVEQTIFFAGEALYSGIMKGTVEAALVTGKEAALKILKSINR